MSNSKWIVPAQVVEIVDGDTVRLDLDLGWHITYRIRVRIVGINAPEMKTPAGVAAKQFAATLLKPGDQVTFSSGSLDKWGRPLGEIIYGPDNLHFGQEMLRAGHAAVLKY